MLKNRNRSIKGVQNIKTHAGKVDHVSHPHMAYMRISCLEMEKARKNKEKSGAQKRIDMINQRLMEIEKEKAHIQRILGDTSIALESSNVDHDSEIKGGFKIKY
ncbi:hypothetical protein SAMN02746065_1089 [Desulfocicer vacuolatum DSM 3385]|uniref:Uncharacterized protein n=1 Tax=Desulfocicer vacuolatum DSM 3385 TaxID=1121400 RepID=A0A1W2BF57_9BACT|nr:hypothetical protein [Desulfocicer vacuolatum]SMC70988.1 hypothetical protein SAMN02746065_1089 [Desulfocicer vacuolatum DSM 3385]